jgi:hypothetical protein
MSVPAVDPVDIGRPLRHITSGFGSIDIHHGRQAGRFGADGQTVLEPRVEPGRGRTAW